MVDDKSTLLEKMRSRMETSEALADKDLRPALAHCIELLYRSELEVERLTTASPDAKDKEKVGWANCTAKGCFDVASPKYVNGLCETCWAESKEIRGILRVDNEAVRKQYLLEEIQASALYQRREECALLRQEGYSAADIAEKLGMKIRQVYRDIEVKKGIQTESD